MQNLITQHLDIWTAAHKTRSTAGRGSSNKLDLYGIKKLRELILELAVRGKLVPQDVNDEPASELLKRIATEKTKLIKAGVIKKEKPLPEITEEEKPFELSAGWEFVRLSGVAYSQAGFAFKSTGFNESGSGLPLIRIRDVGQDFSGTYFDGDFREEFVVHNGDYLISMDGNFRVAKWLGKSALLNQRVSRLIFMGGFVVPAFIAESLQARLLELQGVKAYTTVDHLSGGQISESIIGLPPLPEQHRIVAKVDELMAFCDQLEQTQSDNIAAHAQLVEALLATLTNSGDHNELQNNWQRIAAHFDTLFATEHSIDQLKQTILQLAVMGKLVPQNPNDEPASELIKKIAAEKAQLIKEAKIKKEKPLPEITEEEKPFELPSGWEWAKLGDLADFQKGYAFKSEEYLNAGRMITKIQNLSENSIKNSAYITLDRESEFDQYIIREGDIVMTTVGSWFSAPLSAVGRSFLINRLFDDSFLNQNAVRIRFFGDLNPIYFHTHFKSSIFKSYLMQEAQGTANQASITQASIKNSPIGIPPLAEQHRIVAKVDELMSLCDALKTNLQNAQTTQLALADALVEQAVN
jgi:type I restriction enzyme, S subunit